MHFLGHYALPTKSTKILHKILIKSVLCPKLKEYITRDQIFLWKLGIISLKT